MKTLRTQREIPASIEKVFAAMTDPERLAKWWGPAGFSNTFEICEIKPGGQWIFTMHGPDGHDYPNECRFEDILENEKIVINHVVEPHFVLTLSLSSVADGTLLDWYTVFENEKFVEAMKDILIPANEQNIDRLIAEVLEK